MQPSISLDAQPRPTLKRVLSFNDTNSATIRKQRSKIEAVYFQPLDIGSHHRMAVPSNIHVRASSADILLRRIAALELEVCVCPVTCKRNSRMEDRQGEHGNHDHGTFEDHKGDFLVGEGAVEALAEFRNTVDRTDENGEGGESES